MNRIALTLAVLRYVPYSLASIAAVLLTWLLAPLLALTAFATEDPVTHQGDLPTWLRWFQTHDAPLDEVWRGQSLYMKNFRTFDGKTPDDVRNSRGLRYLARVFWLWRNPAYGFRAQVLGFAREGAAPVHTSARGAAWDSGANSWTFTVAERPGANVFLRSAFHVRGQLFYWPGAARYVRINVGWKLVMPGIAMVATHVNPIRLWEPPPPPAAAVDPSDPPSAGFFTPGGSA